MISTPAAGSGDAMKLSQTDHDRQRAAIDRSLTLELVRVTEAASIAAGA